MSRNPNRFSLFLIVVASTVCLFSDARIWAQDAEPSAVRNNELKKIDAKASKADEVFLRNAFEFAAEYEKAGDVARAIDYLRAMSLVKPGEPKIEEKLRELREQVLTANEFIFKHEPTTTWGKPVAFVKSGKPFRIAVEGTYKLSLNGSISPEGFPEDDGQIELIDNAPFGKLMGVIVEDPTKPIRKGRKIVTFDVGTGREMMPRQSGYLFLKVNLPPQAKPSGTLQIQLSGYVLAPDGKNIGKVR